MTGPRDARDETYTAAVKQRVKEKQRARRVRSGFKHLAHVGTLAWTFLLPVVGGAAAGRLLARLTGARWIAIVALLFGVAAGAYAAFRQVRQSLRDEAEGEDR